MIRRTIITTITALVILSTFAIPADAAAINVNLETRKTAAVVEGDTAWVALSWSAHKGDVTEFRVVAEARTPGMTIEYPENTGDHTSLMDNDTLSDGEIDFTSLKVTVPYGETSAKLQLTATWVAEGSVEEKTFNATVPVGRYSGEDLAQATDHAGELTTTEPAWLGVSWSGLAPVLEDVSMTVAGPAGAAITYPGERTSTSLHYDSTLEDGETDVARFLLDASALSPGTHTLDVTLSYAKADTRLSATGTVTFEVTG